MVAREGEEAEEEVDGLEEVEEEETKVSAIAVTGGAVLILNLSSV